jgi:hypothetical protein
VKVPGGTFVTVKFPILSVVAPLNGFVSPCVNKVTVAYSIGVFDEESITVPVILALASVFSFVCDWVAENMHNSKPIKMPFFTLLCLLSRKDICRF